MKPHPFLILALAASLLAGCASKTPRQAPPPAAAVGKPASQRAATEQTKPSAAKETKSEEEDDYDLYGAVAVSDPFERVNRVTFSFNHGVYTYVLRPISKGYEFIVPKFAREAISNAYENVRFPVRLVNNVLQAKFPRAGQEAGRFLVNTTLGIGGLGRPADGIPILANVPAADSAQTFSKWGIKSGPYLVIPILGPSTAREAVGYAGDSALNPITWLSVVWGNVDWIIAIPSVNTMRSVPIQLAIYDAATKDAIDRYLAARTAYIQYRNEVNSR